MRNLLLAAALAGCGRHETSTPKQAPAEPTAAACVVAHLDADGWIVSRADDGTSRHAGDSLLWTSLAAGLLDCADAARPAAALLQAIQANAGHLPRHPSDLTESDDGKIGAYWGLKRYLSRCVEADRATWIGALKQHRSTVGTALHPQLDDLLASLGARQPITDGTRHLVGKAWIDVAQLTVLGQKPAYRIHLGFLALDQLGTAADVQGWCTEAAPAGMPLVAATCGDTAPLRAFVADFVPDAWEYALQRSPVWESDPDGNGLSTPGLDLLMAQDFLARSAPGQLARGTP